MRAVVRQTHPSFSTGVTPQRFQSITAKYPKLRIAVVGDFCLDRYLEIDPERTELSIETGSAVHNVVNVRAQPGGAGTILNNLAALGIGHICPIGFCGDDGEGFELQRAISSLPGTSMERFLRTSDRRTFTYCKPLIVEPDRPPRELNRLDSKNWTPTPARVEDHLIASIRTVAENVDAIILLDQVDLPETGVLTKRVLDCVKRIATAKPDFLIVADSRRGLAQYPQVVFKMNAAELVALTGIAPKATIEMLQQTAAELARKSRRPVIVTLSEHGIIGATPDGQAAHVPCPPLRGPIDIVGAGDAVTANVTVARAAGANLPEVLELANAAASVVIHQLGTTGTASTTQLRELLFT